MGSNPTGLVKTYADSTQNAAWKVGTAMGMGALAGVPAGPGGMLAGAAYCAGTAAGLHLAGRGLKWGLCKIMPDPQADMVASAAEFGFGFGLSWAKTDSLDKTACGLAGGIIGKELSDQVFPEETTDPVVKAGADALGSMAGTIAGGHLGERFINTQKPFLFGGAEAAPMDPPPTYEQAMNGTTTEAVPSGPTHGPGGPGLPQATIPTQTPTISTEQPPTPTPAGCHEAFSSVSIPERVNLAEFHQAFANSTISDTPDFTLVHDGRECRFSTLAPFLPECPGGHNLRSLGEMEILMEAACPKVPAKDGGDGESFDWRPVAILGGGTAALSAGAMTVVGCLEGRSTLNFFKKHPYATFGDGLKLAFSCKKGSADRIGLAAYNASTEEVTIRFTNGETTTVPVEDLVLVPTQDNVSETTVEPQSEDGDEYEDSLSSFDEISMSEAPVVTEQPSSNPSWLTGWQQDGEDPPEYFHFAREDMGSTPVLPRINEEEEEETTTVRFTNGEAAQVPIDNLCLSSSNAPPPDTSPSDNNPVVSDDGSEIEYLSGGYVDGVDEFKGQVMPSMPPPVTVSDLQQPTEIKYV